MSCAATVSSTNPDGSNVQNCEENSRWIELTVKQPSGGNNETVVVSDYQCDTCGFIADCIPPFFENYTGSLAATTSETTAPESSAIGMAWRTPVTLIMAFVTSCVALS
eukprot:Sro516_g158580.1 n/a (108) ;mRNA; r:53635-53958